MNVGRGKEKKEGEGKEEEKREEGKRKREEGKVRKEGGMEKDRERKRRKCGEKGKAWRVAGLPSHRESWAVGLWLWSLRWRWCLAPLQVCQARGVWHVPWSTMWTLFFLSPGP